MSAELQWQRLMRPIVVLLPIDARHHIWNRYRRVQLKRQKQIIKDIARTFAGENTCVNTDEGAQMPWHSVIII